MIMFQNNPCKIYTRALFSSFHTQMFGKLSQRIIRYEKIIIIYTWSTYQIILIMVFQMFIASDKKFSLGKIAASVVLIYY